MLHIRTSPVANFPHSAFRVLPEPSRGWKLFLLIINHIYAIITKLLSWKIDS